MVYVSHFLVELFINSIKKTPFLYLTTNIILKAIFFLLKYKSPFGSNYQKIKNTIVSSNA